VARVDGTLVRAGAELEAGETVAMTFGDKVTRNAVVDGAAAADPVAKPEKPAKPAKPKPASTAIQRDLF
jgi:exodeoxyribonuclease VII large subunit